jgi:hypothetical protein
MKWIKQAEGHACLKSFRRSAQLQYSPLARPFQKDLPDHSPGGQQTSPAGAPSLSKIKRPRDNQMAL